MTSPHDAAPLRARRDALIADASVRGRALGESLAALVDDALHRALGDPDVPVAVVALGSYARRELCPGSDVDVLLVHRPGVAVDRLADALWYPLWDAGIVLGHAARTVKQTRRLLAHDRDTLTALLDGRVVAGGAPGLGFEVVEAARAHAARDRAAVVARLADDSVLRRLRPGPVAEMLEPNLKDGAGGLRDLQALEWAGWCLGGPGTAALVEAGVLDVDDAGFLGDARRVLLDVRVALHRVTGSRSDVLALQEQDAVATALARRDADVLVHDLAATTRRAAWIADDAWPRLRVVGRRSRPSRRDLGDGIVEVDGRIGDESGQAIDGNRLLHLARLAAEVGATVDRAALRHARRASAPLWDAAARADLVGLLRCGRAAVDVFAALDHEDLVSRVIPEWEHVRSRPQRNAYHRFTVDRHLVETVAEAATLLDDPSSASAGPAARLERPDLLLLAALLHDIGKGRVGDHSTAGAATAGAFATRIGLDASGAATLAWLVHDHLAMADTATRRDLADPVTVARFAARVGDAERLRLLTLLTVADSRATGPAAWGPGKAALVQELYERALARWTGEPVRPLPPVPHDSLAGPGVAVEWSDLGDGRLRCSVGAPDRRGLLADVAGALSLEGFDIDAAEGHSLPGGRAAEVFDGTDPLDRLAEDAGRARAGATIRAVLAGEVSVAEGISARRAAYRAASVDPDAVRVVVVPDEAAGATLVEVYAPDALGLLARLAQVFVDADLDVSTVRAATTGADVVDVFYVRDDAGGSAWRAPSRLAALERALRDALGRD